MYAKIKKRMFEVIQKDNAGDKASKAFDMTVISLIILNVVVVVAGTFNISPETQLLFDRIEYVSVILFTIEYFLRIWTADYLYPELSEGKSRLKYARSFLALIDLMAILPFYLPLLIPVDLRVLRVLRIVRLTRLFKVHRYTNAISTVVSVFKKKADELFSAMFAVVILMIIASVLMYYAEHDAQPDVFENAFSGLWWAIVTLTTVGYGDIYPVTVAGKFLSASIALLGIGLVAVPTSIISVGFMENLDSKKAQKAGESHEKHFCPYCGERLDDGPSLGRLPKYPKA